MRPAPTCRSTRRDRPAGQARARRARGALGSALGGRRHLPLRPRRQAASEVFSIDTPPPTVSGSLHVGHVFSFTQTDVVARFQRMRGKAVFYPIGWDDNGLPTERRVQNHYRRPLRPVAPLRPGLRATDDAAQNEPIPISRPNFVELCQRADRRGRAGLRGALPPPRPLGRLDDSSTRRSAQTPQRDLAARLPPHARAAARPTVRRPRRCGTSTSTPQSPRPSSKTARSPAPTTAFASRDADGTASSRSRRPAPSCSPPASRSSPTPTTSAISRSSARRSARRCSASRSPSLAHPLADPEKGIGIAMVCTFGDLTDVTWWRELRCRPGRSSDATAASSRSTSATSAFPSTRPRSARTRAYARARRARRSARHSDASSSSFGEQARSSASRGTITHAVKFYETRRTPARDRLLEASGTCARWRCATSSSRPGASSTWHPEFMRARYESWVEGLTGDWNISRQRYFGVPFPRLVPRRRGRHDRRRRTRSSPTRRRCPIDPSLGRPAGLRASDSGARPAASSATPTSWTPGRRPRSRPRSPGAGTTTPTCSRASSRWICARRHTRSSAPGCSRPSCAPTSNTARFPGRHAAISGWILDPDRKKMSKSKGNVVVPTELLDKHGTDAVRYWAASARLGVDTVFDEQQMKIGRRLAIKILNASKFALSRRRSTTASRRRRRRARATRRRDARRLARVVAEARRGPSRSYEHARALERTEQFFWTFCDDYLELVKGRAYGERSRRRIGASGARHRALGPACGSSHRSSRSRPKRPGRGGTTARSTRAAGRPIARDPAEPASAPPALLERDRRASSARCGGRRRSPRSACGPRSTRVDVRGPAGAARARSSWRAATSATRAASDGLELVADRRRSPNSWSSVELAAARRRLSPHSEPSPLARLGRPLQASFEFDWHEAPTSPRAASIADLRRSPSVGCRPASSTTSTAQQKTSTPATATCRPSHDDRVPAPRAPRRRRIRRSATTLFGRALAMPLVLSPTGFSRIADPAGELAVARAAERAGLPYTLSTHGDALDRRGRRGDRPSAHATGSRSTSGGTADSSQRCSIGRKAANYEAIMITVDTAVLGRRERDVRRGFTLPPKIGLETLHRRHRCTLPGRSTSSHLSRSRSPTCAARRARDGTTRGQPRGLHQLPVRPLARHGRTSRGSGSAGADRSS